MQPNPEVVRQIEKFLDLAFRFQRKSDSWYTTRKDFWGLYSPKPRDQYLHIRAGCGNHFRVHPETGAIRTWSRRAQFIGHIADFLKATDWRYGKIKWDGSGLPSRICQLCGRSEGVHMTQLGLRCRVCRGVDGRHFSSIRALGVPPRVNGQPANRYLLD